MHREIVASIVLLLAWLAAVLIADVSAPAINLLLAAAGTLFVRGWAVTR